MPDDGNRLALPEWQNIILVLQQHSAGQRGLLRQGVVRVIVAGGGFFPCFGGPEHKPQHALGASVNIRFRKAAVTNEGGLENTLKKRKKS